MMMTAALEGASEMVEILIDRGLDVNGINKVSL